MVDGCTCNITYGDVAGFTAFRTWSVLASTLSEAEAEPGLNFRVRVSFLTGMTPAVGHTAFHAQRL